MVTGIVFGCGEQLSMSVCVAGPGIHLNFYFAEKRQCHKGIGPWRRQSWANTLLLHLKCRSKRHHDCFVAQSVSPPNWLRCSVPRESEPPELAAVLCPPRIRAPRAGCGAVSPENPSPPSWLRCSVPRACFRSACCRLIELCQPQAGLSSTVAVRLCPGLAEKEIE